MNRARMLCLATLLLLVACGGGDGPTSPPAVTSVTITTSSGTLAAIGETTTLTALAKSAKGATISGATITWSSSSPNVATVSGGVVTAVGNGTTTISATADGIAGTTQITVQQSVTQVSVTFASDTIRALGDTARASATPRDARGNAVAGKTATWSSLTPSVVTIDGTGLMTAIAEGTGTVVVTVDAQQGQRVVQVRQRAAKLVIMTQPDGARAGIALTTQPVVEVQDARGNRVTTDNATVVTATIATGGGTVTAGATATASAGLATFAGLAVGGTVGSRVLQLGNPTTGSVNSAAFMLDAGNPSTLVVASGNGQSGLANTSLAQALSAGARDAYGNAVAGVTVNFAVMQGGGSVAPASAETNAAGNASSTYTLGRNAGAAQVRASSPAIAAASVDFAATATPNGIISGTITVLPFNVSAGLGSAGAGARARASLVSSSATHRRLPNAPTVVAPPLINGNKPVRMVDVAQRADAPAASTLPASSPAPEGYVPGELLVTYHADAIGAPALGSRSFAQRAVSDQVATTVRQALQPAVRSGRLSVAGVSPAILTARVVLAPGVSEAEAMSELRRDPRVRSVERNGLMRTQRVMPSQLDRYLLPSVPPLDLAHVGVGLPTRGEPARAAFPVSGTFPGNALYLNQAWHYHMMDLPRAWSLTQGSTSVLVAVVDDGIRFDHPAMTGVLTNDGYDFVPVGTVPACAGGVTSTNGDGNGPDPDPTAPSYVDYNAGNTCVFGPEASGNHGLHVSGTIGATQVNATGVVGVNWQVRIRPVRVMGVHGSGSYFTIAQGILYAAGLPADDGSGGTVTPSGPPARVINLSLGGTSASVVLQNAVTQAQANGALIVAAAGNNNSSANFYPAVYADISVSSVGPTMNRSSFSNFGSTITVAAPGGQTSAGFTHGIMSSTWNFQTNSARTDSWQGTSMATPHVVGLAALILAREPGLTAAQVRQRIVNYAVDLGSPGRDNIYGWGLVNARNSLTATLGPARTVMVRVVNALTGAVVRTATATNGAYSVGQLADGQYWVFAGEDDSGDQLTGLPTRAWGAFGGSAIPTAIVVNGADVYPASFDIYRANEFEPNGTAELADELLVDGYLQGDLTTVGDVDFVRVKVAQAGTYVVQVTGQQGACRYALEADPTVTLLTAGGATIAANDDIDTANSDFCSRVTSALTPGDYYVRVGAVTTGRYVVSIRRQ